MIWYLENGSLISKDSWKKHIQTWKDESKEASIDLNEAIHIIEKELLHSMQTIPKEPIGIFFSGGVDSTVLAFLCKKLDIPFHCYTVGFQDSNFKTPEDIIWAKKVAKELDFPLTAKIFNLNECADIFKKTVNYLGENTNVVNVGVGGVVVAAKSLGKEKIWLSGLGSEELFAGYERHKQNPTNDECWNGLFGMYERDLIRDTILAKAMDISIMTPLLEENLLVASLNLPISLKIQKEQVKVIFREVAKAMGMPKHIAERKKRAAQYGSSFDKAIAKLTKQNGFEFKKDYLENLKE